MNNDELQKAIDDITRDNASAEAAPAVDAAASTVENEQLANELAGAAPASEAVAPETAATPVVDAAPVVAETDFAPAPAPAPEVPVEPAMPPMSRPVAAPETSVVETVSAAPEAAAPVSDNATLEEAMRELYPLLDKVEMPVEEKFEITMKYGEPAKALELAKQIADDTSKANALMKIIEKLK